MGRTWDQINALRALQIVTPDLQAFNEDIAKGRKPLVEVASNTAELAEAQAQRSALRRNAIPNEELRGKLAYVLTYLEAKKGGEPFKTNAERDQALNAYLKEQIDAGKVTGNLSDTKNVLDALKGQAQADNAITVDDRSVNGAQTQLYLSSALGVNELALKNSLVLSYLHLNSPSPNYMEKLGMTYAYLEAASPGVSKETAFNNLLDTLNLKGLSLYAVVDKAYDSIKDIPVTKPELHLDGTKIAERGEEIKGELFREAKRLHVAATKAAEEKQKQQASIESHSFLYNLFLSPPSPEWTTGFGAIQGLGRADQASIGGVTVRE